MIKRVILSLTALALLCYLLGVLGFVRAFVLSFLALCYVPPFLFIRRHSLVDICKKHKRKIRQTPGKLSPDHSWMRNLTTACTGSN